MNQELMEDKNQSASPPKNVPRKKTLIYLFLLFLTTTFIFVYSFPFEINLNNFTFINNQKLKKREFSDDISNNENIISNIPFIHTFIEYEIIKTSSFSSLHQDSSESESLHQDFSSFPSTFTTESITKSTIPTSTSIKSEKIFPSTNFPITTTSSKLSENVTLTHSFQQNEISTTKKVKNENTTNFKLSTTGSPSTEPKIAERNTTNYESTSSFMWNAKSTNTSELFFQNNSTESSDLPKGFLVFSKYCKIPDIDPMHPSIKKFVRTSPPLNCKKKEPITKTNGNYLILDAKAVKKRRFKNFTCCFKAIYRDKDGFSDDKIKYGSCKTFSNITKIEDEFIEVNCKDENGNLIYQEFHSFIQVKPNVEKRCEKQNDHSYSVMIIGVDGLSRLNMHRQLKKTVRYLLNDLEAIEMFGLNKIGDNTFPNLVALLLGYDQRELSDVCWNSDKEPLDKCNFLWKRFADKGYRTLYAEDTPYLSSFNYVKEGFYHQPTDYYFRHFILPYEDKLGWYKPLNCHLCVGSISETEAVLNWNKLFANEFKERAYFSFSWINSATHDYLNFGSGADHMYEKFFSSLHKSEALNRTILIVMSDHGMRWGKIRQTFVGRLEERLPSLFIVLPPQFRKEYPNETKALENNSHRLITPYDLHATLLNLLHLKENWTFSNVDDVSEGLSLNYTKRAHTLLQNIPIDRSCDDAFIDEHWCTCEASLPMNQDEEVVQDVSKFLVEHINTLLRPAFNICASLELSAVSDARLLSPNFEHDGHKQNDNIYTVIIRTKPGMAIFEGTVRVSDPNKEPELLGEISRLNLYGDQSKCIQNAILKKYCFCS